MNNQMYNEDFLKQEIPVVKNTPVNKSQYGKYGTQNNNCVRYKDQPFSLQQLTKLTEDQCYLKEKTERSLAVGNYNLSNFNTCDCDINQVIEKATENPDIVFRDGYGISECNVNTDSALRIGKTRKFPKCPDQLFIRPIGTVPFMGRGSGNSQVEYQILQGEQTREKRECNVLSGVNIENYFTPLVDPLQKTIQNPENLIEEASDPTWIRGGTPSRQIVKDIDYLQRCSDTVKNKKLLVENKGYLNRDNNIGYNSDLLR